MPVVATPLRALLAEAWGCTLSSTLPMGESLPRTPWPVASLLIVLSFVLSFPAHLPGTVPTVFPKHCCCCLKALGAWPGSRSDRGPPLGLQARDLVLSFSLLALRAPAQVGARYLLNVCGVFHAESARAVCPEVYGVPLGPFTAFLWRFSGAWIHVCVPPPPPPQGPPILGLKGLPASPLQ